MSQTNVIGKAHTSVLYQDNNVPLEVCYHSTTVVKAWLDQGIVRLDTGGYRSQTTRPRMVQTSNQFDLGFNVSFANGEFTVWSKYGWEIKVQGESVIFHLGSGRIVNEVWGIKQ